AHANSPPAPRSVNVPTPSPCESNYPTTSFNGVHGVQDHAGAYASAVLGGANNEACANTSGIGAGGTNGIGSGASASFIGGGQFNGIIGNDSFIGAGYGNSAGNRLSTLSAAFVGTGFYNYAGAEASFVGAGDEAYWVAQTNKGNLTPAPGNVAYAVD